MTVKKGNEILVGVDKGDITTSQGAFEKVTGAKKKTTRYFKLSRLLIKNQWTKECYEKKI